MAASGDIGKPAVRLKLAQIKQSIKSRCTDFKGRCSPGATLDVPLPDLQRLIYHRHAQPVPRRGSIFAAMCQEYASDNILPGASLGAEVWYGRRHRYADTRSGW